MMLGCEILILGMEFMKQARAPEYWLKSFIFLLIYFLVGKLSLLIHALAGYYPMIWLPSGVGLGLLVVAGNRFWISIFLGSCALGLSQHLDLGYCLVLALGSTLESLVGAYLFKKFSGVSRPTLTTVKEVLVFIISAVGISTLIGSVFVLICLHLFGGVSDEKLIFTWKIWWFSEAMGQLIIGTAIICWCNDIQTRMKFHKSKRLELIFFCLLICTAVILIYTPVSRHFHSLLFRPYCLFPIMIWMAVRFDSLGVVIVNLALNGAMVVGAVLGIVPYSSGSLVERTFIHQLIAMTLGLTGFVLAAAIREREWALDAKTQFISVASHELKTPITALKLQYDSLSRQFERDEKMSTLSIQNFLQRAGRQISRLNLVIEELLNTARLEQGTFDLNISDIKLSVLLRNILETLSPNFAAARTEAKLVIQDELVAHWDPFRMEQVLTNILSNAIKYAPGKPIEVSVTSENKWALIKIKDYGPGIDLQNKEQIFNRFVRAGQRTVEGIGLGLFIARQIVLAHGGQIEVQSTLGEGATFEIRMPLEALSNRSRLPI